MKKRYKHRRRHQACGNLSQLSANVRMALKRRAEQRGGDISRGVAPACWKKAKREKRLAGLMKAGRKRHYPELGEEAACRHRWRRGILNSITT